MKVILSQDVKGVGKKYDVKDVSDGHALNMLIPRGLVREATAGALKQAEIQKQKQEVARQVQEELLVKNISELGAAVIHMSAKANEQGHLFAAIHKEDISKRLKDEVRLDVLPEFIHLEHPLKALGEHEISVSVRDQKTKFKVVIEKGV